MELTHFSLFTGIGGIDLAAEWAGFKTIGQCEIDEYATKVLKKHWPDVTRIRDVRDISRESVARIMADARLLGQTECEKQGTGSKQSGETICHAEFARREKAGKRCQQHSGAEPQEGDRSRLTLLSGGFPCQPHSVAGRRKGAADERDLWPEFRRVIGEVRPRWVLAENVPGLLSNDAGRFFRGILRDLSSMGYSAGWCTFGAVDVGALHRRDRVFIVAHAKDSSFPDTEPRSGGETGAPLSVGDTEYDGQPATQVSGMSMERGNARLQKPKQTGEPTRPSKQYGYVEELSQTGLQQDVPNTEYPSPPRQRKDSRKAHTITESARLDFSSSQNWWAVEPNVGRVANGIPSRVDRLKCLGNAVVPQQVYPVLRAIADYEMGLET